MSIKCPKCQSDNPETATFCADCGTQLTPSDEVSPSVTKTLETPVTKLAIGSIFAERYEILEELGKGGMGEVYRVKDETLDEEMALKVLKPEIAAYKGIIERFKNELKLARKIAHKHVCKMYDLNEEEETPYITMEYVSGEDLKSFIRRKEKLKEEEVIAVAKQVCEGLAEAHELGVVHRDLKPQNIMIDEKGNAKVMDFGIARSIEAPGVTQSGVMIGTPDYMSPEQAEGGEADHRSDIYSLGVILYEMETGQVPFQGDTALSVAIKHKTEIPLDPRKLNPQISDDMAHVILRCIAKEKERRYQTARDLLSEFIKIEKGIPTEKRFLPKRGPLATLHQKKLLFSLVAVIALVIIAAVVWHFIPREEVLSAPKIENSIAIISFRNQTGDEDFNYLQNAISDLLITNLENTGNFYVATRERMRDILKQMGKKEVEFIDSDLGFELCRKEGIESIVLGSFIKAGDTFTTDVKVLDVETKNLIKSAKSTGKTVDNILERQIDELSREIAQSIDVGREKTLDATFQIAEVTTSFPEAYKNFLKGREAVEKQYHNDARPLLEKAVEIDPTFASAYLYLAIAYSGPPNRDMKAHKEALKNAIKYAERATEKERLYIEVSVERDLEKRFQILQKMAIKYPREKRVHSSLGAIYLDKELYNNAFDEYNKVFALDPGYSPAYNELVYDCIFRRDFEKALEYAEKWKFHSPNDTDPLDSIAESYFRMGKLDEAISRYKKVFDVKPDSFHAYWAISYIHAFREDYPKALEWCDRLISAVSSPSQKALGYSWKAMYHILMGNLDQSLKDSDQMEAFAKEEVSLYLEKAADWTRGYAYRAQREFDLSRRSFDSFGQFMIENFARLENTVQTALLVVSVDIAQGQGESARSRLVEIEDLVTGEGSGCSQRLKYWHDLLWGEIFLAEDLPEEAVKICANAKPMRTPIIGVDVTGAYNMPLFRDVLAKAYLRNGELDKAIAEYEGLINFDPMQVERWLIHPLYHYRLGKLYEEKGWPGRAIEEYEKFLSLWKDADPGIAEVEDARKRLAGLKSVNL